MGQPGSTNDSDANTARREPLPNDINQRKKVIKQRIQEAQDVAKQISNCQKKVEASEKKKQQVIDE